MKGQSNPVLPKELKLQFLPHPWRAEGDLALRLASAAEIGDFSSQI
jgi:hypothetical protein